MQSAVLRECSDLQIELLQRSMFTFHKPSHSLVPKHVALSEAEAAEFLDAHFCKREDLEVLLTIDAMSQWYDFKIGTLVRIERRYGSGLISPSVRVVAKPS